MFQKTTHTRALPLTLLLLVSLFSVGSLTTPSTTAAAATSALTSSVHPDDITSDADGTVAAAPTPDGQGFWTVTANGTVSTEGDATFYGDASSLSLNASIVGIAATFDGRGYWLLGADGGVFSYGDASFYGSTGNLKLNAPALAMVSTADSRGYWFVASDGGIFSFGDASFYGSEGGKHLNKPIVGMAAQPSGGGYWLVAADGGIFSYGNAQFHGSTGNLTLNEPVVGMAPTSNGSGYWLVASDGGIFAFNAPFYGSASGDASSGTVVSMVATGDGGGYWIIGNDGNIYPYGDAATTGGQASSGSTALSPEYLGETQYVETDDSPQCWDGSFTDTVATIDGQDYTQSINTQVTSCLDASENLPSYVEYNLDREYNWFNATLGLDDNGTSSSALVQFQIFGDGVQLFSQNISFGQAVPIHLSVTGVLRLKLQVTDLPISGNYYDALADFGSAVVTP